MNRAQDPFDGAKAVDALHTIAANAKTFATLFPDTTKGADQNASPAIWEKKADFDSRLSKLAVDAAAGAAAAGKGEADFKSAFATIQPQCGGCHQIYRND